MSIRKGGKRGTHGSLTKAGKVRELTPKIIGRKIKSKNPRRSNLKAYRKLMNRNSSAYHRGKRGWLGTQRRR